MNAHFINRQGYELVEISSTRKWFWPCSKTVLYHCKMDPVAPLTFVDADGGMHRTFDAEFDTDLASTTVPALDLLGISPDCCECSAIMHDEGYHRHRELYCAPGSDVWAVREITKAQADQWLHDGALDENNYRWQADLLQWGVEKFGQGAWNNGSATGIEMCAG